MNGRLEKKEKRSFFFSLIRGWLTYLYLSLRGHFFFPPLSPLLLHGVVSWRSFA